MTERREAAGRPPRALLPRRNRKRWLIAAAIAACWLALLDMTGSIIGATLLLVLFAVLGLVTVLALRALGVTRDHPWVQQLASRPWRDGQDVLKLALRHLHEVFVITPSGALIAPERHRAAAEPGEPPLAGRADGTRADQPERGPGLRGPGRRARRQLRGPRPGRRAGHRRPVGPAGPLPAAAGAAGRRWLPGGPAVRAPRAGHDARQAPSLPTLPRGPLRRSPPAQAGAHAVYAAPRAVPEGPYRGFAGHDGHTGSHQEATTRPAGRARKLPPVTDMPTVTELSRSPIPVLRLVTGGLATETRVSGARAGRGEVELGLPQVPTVSREHARFTFSDGQWWIANLGRTGSPSTAPRWWASSRSAAATRSAGACDRTPCSPRSRSVRPRGTGP